MARRRIGQEDLIARPEPRAASSLTGLAALLDWHEIDRALVGISAAAEGEPGWPPLALFRALLLATWHDLSDIRLAGAPDDRGSFRRFCGFAAREPTPERTADARNAAVRRARRRIEKAFGTRRRSHGLRRMRWLGLAKAGLQARLTATAHNLRRTVTLLQGGVARCGRSLPASSAAL